MPDQKPNDAPDALRPRDADTAASVLSQDDDGAVPGGGGLGSEAVAAADPLADRTPGGTAPNASIDVATPDDAEGSDALAEAEARQMAAEAGAPEPRPTSQ